MSKTEEIISDTEQKRKSRIKAGIFLSSIAGVSAIIGFSKTVSTAKRNEQKFLQAAGPNAAVLLDGGTSLAMRALGWGTLYAVMGTSAICYGIWKLSGAKDLEDFKQKMGSSLPKITSDKPPTSRTEFDGLTDLMKYLSTWGKE